MQINTSGSGDCGVIGTELIRKNNNAPSEFSEIKLIAALFLRRESKKKILAIQTQTKADGERASERASEKARQRQACGESIKKIHKFDVCMNACAPLSHTLCAPWYLELEKTNRNVPLTKLILLIFGGCETCVRWNDFQWQRELKWC